MIKKMKPFTDKYFGSLFKIVVIMILIGFCLSIPYSLFAGNSSFGLYTIRVFFQILLAFFGFLLVEFVFNAIIDVISEVKHKSYSACSLLKIVYLILFCLYMVGYFIIFPYVLLLTCLIIECFVFHIRDGLILNCIQDMSVVILCAAYLLFFAARIQNFVKFVKAASKKQPKQATANEVIANNVVDSDVIDNEKNDDGDES